MGWWRTSSGSVIGDSPADIIEEFDEQYSQAVSIPPDVRARITACYREDLSREPTELEFRELLEFCGRVRGWS